MRTHDRRGHEGAAHEQSSDTAVAEPPAPSALESYASGVGNQAFATLARSGYEADEQPDLGGYNAEPDYGGKGVDPRLDDPKHGGGAFNPSEGPAVPGVTSENVSGEAKASTHEPQPVDAADARDAEPSPAAETGSSGYEAAAEPDVGGYNAEPDYGGKDVDTRLADPTHGGGAFNESEGPAVPGVTSENVSGEAKASTHEPQSLDAAGTREEEPEG